MALLYAKPTEYAIRALTYLAVHSDQHAVSVQEIAEVEDISSHHLSKVMKNLARGKMVLPLRGPGGGYRLIRDPKEITLWEVMGALSAQTPFDECAIGWANCSDEDPCPLHDRWLEVRANLRLYLEGVTIAELAQVSGHKRKSARRDSPLQIALPTSDS
jgi:Rrf2 family protein